MHKLSGQMVRRTFIVNILLLGLLQGLAEPLAAGEAGRAVRIVAFGDSLTAGFGLKPDEAFPVVLQRVLREKGIAAEVANAGVSGDTTSGGLSRVDWAVPDGTDAVILELGANDALTGRPPAEARKALEAIVLQLKARGIDILLAGMQAPRNLGKEYTTAFDAIYPDLAARHDLILYPFFLDGVALEPKLNLSDGIHPTAEGIRIIAGRMLPKVEEMIARVRARLGGGSRG